MTTDKIHLDDLIEDQNTPEDLDIEEWAEVGVAEISKEEDSELKLKRHDRKRRNIRIVVLTTIVLLTYFFFVRLAFWKQSLLYSMVVFAFLFIEIIFLSIDFREIKKRWFRGFLVLLWLLLRLFMPNPVWQRAVALRISIFSIGFLIYHLRNYFINTRHVNWLTYFTRWGYIFSLMASIFFWFMVLGNNSEVPFDCNQITTWRQKIISTSTSPLRLWMKEDNSIFDSNKDVDELDLELEEEDESWIKQVWNSFKSKMMDWFLETQNSIDNSVCQSIINQINAVYQKPAFQIWVIFWIYLLLYWVIRLLVRVVTIIWYIIFCITKLFWMYKVEKRERLVEEIV